MSYILEALRKSARERRAAESASLPALVSEERPASLRWPVWALGATVLLNLATLGFFWWTGRLSGPSEGPPPQHVPPSIAVTPVAANPVAVQVPAPAPPLHAPPAPAPVAEQAPPPAPAEPVPQAEPTVHLAEPAVNPKTPVKTARPPARPALPVEAEIGSGKGQRRIAVRRTDPIPMDEDPADAEEDADLDDEELEAMEAQEPLSKADRRIGTSRRIESPLPLKRPRPAPLREREDPVAEPDDGIPSLSALPEPVREKVPSIKINLHAYSKAPAERFAVINMQRMEVGDSLPGGAKLVDIRPDSVVLEMDGAKFRVPRP